MAQGPLPRLAVPVETRLRSIEGALKAHGLAPLDAVYPEGWAS